MSKVVSGQLRVEDSSSKDLGQFRQQGNGRGQLKGVVPEPKENKRLNPKKESSHRGKGQGNKGDVSKKGSQLKKSSFTDPLSFISVGGMRLTNANIESVNNKVKEVADKVRKEVKKLDKKGKKDKSGKAVPNKKGGKPPKKVSDLIKKNEKKVIKRVKKIAKGKRGRAKKSMVNEAHNSAHLKE